MKNSRFVLDTQEYNYRNNNKKHSRISGNFKKMKILRLSLVIFTSLIITSQLFASKDEYTKKISKSFDVNKDATLVVNNKFGKIHCENWDKNSIAIEVTITVEASSEEKANKYFNNVDISISGGSDKVIAETSFDDRAFKDNNNGINVDYMINMPKTINVDLNNKFGDIIIDEVYGQAIIDLSYGSIKTNRLTGDNSEIEIKFSEGFIGYIKNGELELKYSELEIDEAGDLNAESKFSDLEIGKIDVLTLESGYDDDFIGSVRDMDIEASFSDVDVRNLEERLIADFDYGELKIRNVAKGFKLIEINNSFSDANVGFHSEAAFKMIATIKMGDLSYPNNRARLSVVDLSYTSNRYEGVIGDDENVTSKVLIESKNSDVNLYYR